MTSVPEQYLPALDRANHVRLARAAVKQRVSSLRGRELRLELIRLLRFPPDELLAMPLDKLLGAAYRWGPRRRGRLLNDVGVLLGGPLSENTRIGRLTDRQVEALVTVLLRGWPAQ